MSRWCSNQLSYAPAKTSIIGDFFAAWKNLRKISAESCGLHRPNTPVILRPMRFSTTLVAAVFSALAFLSAASAQAGEAVADGSAHDGASLMSRASSSIQTAMDDAMNLIGVRYKRGGTSPETGFDCSGFVVHVFREGMGLMLPRTSREISKEGEAVKKSELQPGDLVFFNTMRRTFSHVGIYLGEGQFIHSPRSGGKVRIENLRDTYWAKRYEGARRISME